MKIGTLLQPSIMCEMLHLLLKALGHLPIEIQEASPSHLFAGPGHLADVQAQRSDLDLLLIDTGLPYRHADIEVVKSISTQHYGLPLVLLTLGELPQSQKQELGRVEVLIKPFSSQELQAAIKRATAAYTP